MNRIAIPLLSLIFAATLVGAATPRKIVRVGFFEGGDYYSHSILRTAYHDALEHLAPPDIQFVYVPDGFKSADWKKEECAKLAADYVRDTTIDMVVAIGPWVVPELLKAGYTRPIIGLYQFDPASEGLLGRDGRPVARNLTVQVRPDKIKHDLATIEDLYHSKKIGVLSFNMSPDDTAFMNKCWQIGKSMGIEIVWTQAYGTSGTYAFFKAYGLLPKSVEAVYVSPLWGMSLPMIDQFTANLQSDHIPLFTSEGRFLVEKGVLGSGSICPEENTALFAAWKTVRIALGDKPSDLPIEYPESRGYVVNLVTAGSMAREISSERLYEADLVGEFAPSEEAAPFTIDEAISTALSRNPGYQAAYTAIDAAERSLTDARKGLLPDISIDAAATAASKSASDNTGELVSRERYRAGLAIDQPLISLGTLRSIQQARKEQTLQQANVEQAQHDLELAVNAAYLDCLVARAQIEEYVRLRRRLDDILQSARLGDFASPDRPPDQMRWDTYRINVFRTLIGERRRYTQAVATLNILLGQPSNTEITLDSAGFTEESFVQEFSAIRPILMSRRFGPMAEQYLQTEAVKNNPAIKSSGAAVAVAGARMDFARSERYPGINLRGWFGYVDSLANSPTFTEKHNQWSVGAAFSWPIFGSGRKFPGSKVARFDVDKAEYERDAVRLNVVNAVENGWNGIRSLGAEIPLAAAEIDRAGEYLDSTQFAYLAQKRPIGEAIDAVQTDFQARLDLIRTRQEYYSTVAALIHDIGWSTTDVPDRGAMMIVRKVQEYLRSTLPQSKP